MKKILLPFALLLIACPALFAQWVIEVSYAPDSRGNYAFACTNRAFCNYVVSVTFTTLENMKSDHALPFEAEVHPGVNKLFTLSKINGSDPTQINYKSSNRKGCLHPVADTGFTYLLPIAPGKEATAYEISPKTNYAIRLKMKSGDTIYAARRGTVTDVDVSNEENDAGVTTTSSWNYIEIVQGDCSFAQYGVLKKNGAFVKPGQIAEAGTPIGIVGGDKYGRGSDVRLSVTYTQDQVTTNIPLQFWTKKNGKGMLKHGSSYISEYPVAIVTQEIKKTPGRKPVKVVKTPKKS